MRSTPWTAVEALTIVAARRLSEAKVCFAGIGLPSAAAILATRTSAPDLYLVYESGAFGPHPRDLPLSVADEELASTAQMIVSVPEVFAYWLQPGRIDVGVLGAAQIDRYANINSTVIGSYDRPKVRLPGAGGAPEIAASCGSTMILLRHDPRALVADLDFVTTVGHGRVRGDRVRFGFVGGGPRVVITDLGVLEPDPGTFELTLTAVHPGVTVEAVRAATGWDLRVAPVVTETPAPTDHELEVLRSLERSLAGG